MCLHVEGRQANSKLMYSEGLSSISFFCSPYPWSLYLVKWAFEDLFVALSVIQMLLNLRSIGSWLLSIIRLQRSSHRKKPFNERALMRISLYQCLCTR